MIVSAEVSRVIKERLQIEAFNDLDAYTLFYSETISRLYAVSRDTDAAPQPDGLSCWG